MNSQSELTSLKAQTHIYAHGDIRKQAKGESFLWFMNNKNGNDLH